MAANPIRPPGGASAGLIVDAAQAARLKEESRDWLSWGLTDRQVCDVESLACGGFSPLGGFMTRRDYAPVCESMRLADGSLWPIPVTLDVTAELADRLAPGAALALRDGEGVMLAVLHVEDVWEPDLEAEAHAVYGTGDERHPAVRYLRRQSHPRYVGGTLEGLQLPLHYDFRALRHTPAEVRREFSRRGWSRVVAFQPRDPVHRAQQAMTLRAAGDLGAGLLIQPAVGLTAPGDLDHYARIRCFEGLLKHYPQQGALLSLLPLVSRGDGPRETLWHALLHRNYGCTDVIVGPAHADPGAVASDPVPHAAREARDLLARHATELGVGLVPAETWAYVPERSAYLPPAEVPPGAAALRFSAAELEACLAEGSELPRWFTFPEVAEQLRRRHPPRRQQGLTVFFTGLSGSGKSTIANALLVKLLALGGRSVTLLDGDVVRRHLSSELGFSREHRNVNILRIGYVASEITKHGGIAICAPIAPYEQIRREVASMISPLGGFILVHVDTPLAECERRDRKGLYAKARAGIIQEFTGISDPYDTPEAADVTLRTAELGPDEAAQAVVQHLRSLGYLPAGESP